MMASVTVSPRRELAVERLREGRTIPQMEARLQLPDGDADATVRGVRADHWFQSFHVIRWTAVNLPLR